MSLNLEDLPRSEEVRLGRTALSKRELQRGGVLARLEAGELRRKDAAAVTQVSYRQAKRLWKRYQAGGAAALKHGNAGRKSNRARPEKERKKILKLVREKYGGDENKRFGPTLAAEHRAREDQQKVHHEAAKPVSAGRILSRSQRSFCAGASGTAGLSSQGAEGAGVGAGVLFGDRAQHFQRLGRCGMRIAIFKWSAAAIIRRGRRR